MKRYSLTVALFLIFLAGFAGCATLNDYHPKTPDEAGIKAILLQYFQAWENYDADRLLAVIHDDARIIMGREGVVLSKKQYSEILPRRFREEFRKSPTVRWGSPEMKVWGDYATVYMPITTPDFHSRIGTILTKDNGQWQIIGNPY